MQSTKFRTTCETALKADRREDADHIYQELVAKRDDFFIGKKQVFSEYTAHPGFRHLLQLYERLASGTLRSHEPVLSRQLDCFLC